MDKELVRKGRRMNAAAMEDTANMMSAAMATVAVLRAWHPGNIELKIAEQQLTAAMEGFISDAGKLADADAAKVSAEAGTGVLIGDGTPERMRG